MLSYTRFMQTSRQISLAAASAASAETSIKSQDSKRTMLPPELISAVFEHLGLKELLPCRHVSNNFKHLVDTEAKLMLMALTGDAMNPIVLQAGPPALFDICEHLPLQLSDFGGKAGYLTSPPLLATLTVSHQVHNPYHTTTMGADENQYFQNIVLSITQRERKLQESPTYNRQLAFGGWNSWEVARENDRIWRHWWDDAPSSSTEGTPSACDSGFAESSFLDRQDKQKTCQQSLEIGKTIHRATMQLSTSGDRQEEHEYRWKSVDIDVYRVLLACEERTNRTGMRAVLGSTIFRL